MALTMKQRKKRALRMKLNAKGLQGATRPLPPTIETKGEKKAKIDGKTKTVSKRRRRSGAKKRRSFKATSR